MTTMFSYEVLALPPQILPVSSCAQKKKVRAKKKRLDGKKTNKYEILLPYQSVRETVLTSCGITFRITCNQNITRNISVVLVGKIRKHNNNHDKIKSINTKGCSTAAWPPEGAAADPTTNK